MEENAQTEREKKKREDSHVSSSDAVVYPHAVVVLASEKHNNPTPSPCLPQTRQTPPSSPSLWQILKISLQKTAAAVRAVVHSQRLYDRASDADALNGKRVSPEKRIEVLFVQTSSALYSQPRLQGKHLRPQRRKRGLNLRSPLSQLRRSRRGARLCASAAKAAEFEVQNELLSAPTRRTGTRTLQSLVAKLQTISGTEGWRPGRTRRRSLPFYLLQLGVVGTVGGSQRKAQKLRTAKVQVSAQTPPHAKGGWPLQALCEAAWRVSALLTSGWCRTARARDSNCPARCRGRCGRFLATETE